MITAGPLRWALLGTSLLFASLGALFVCQPEQATALFGIPANTVAELVYVRAVGMRDVALAGYIALLTLFASTRAVLIVLSMTLVIPAGDLVLVAMAPYGGPLQLGLHLASATLFAGLAIWVWTRVRSLDDDGRPR